jgi:hypothetical protein
MKALPSVELPGWLRRVQLSVDLLVSRRALLVVIVDLLILFAALIAVLMAEHGGEHGPLFQGVVLWPYLILGVPVMADATALERRAGSLDLALSSPGRAYFERRIGTSCGLMAAQGSAIMLLDWCVSGLEFPILPPLLHAVIAAAFLGSAVLFWAVRIRGVGAVALATFATALVAGTRLFSQPILQHVPGKLIHPLNDEDFQQWILDMAVLSLVTLLLYLYARRRLVRPELLLR